MGKKRRAVGGWGGGRVLLSILALLLWGIQGSPLEARQGFTSEDLRTLRSVSGIEVSPSGEQILYGVVYSDRDAPPYTRYRIVDPAGEEHRDLLPDGDVSVSNPRWSPDGEWIGFIGSEGGRRGVMIVRPDGSDLRFLEEAVGTNHPLPGAEQHIAWSPDGNRIAYLSSTPGPETEEAEGDPIVIRRYNYKTSGAGGDYFTDNRRLQIHVVDVASGNSTRLTDNVYQDHSLDWSPDGREILFVSNREPQNDRNHDYDLFALDPEDGSERRITALESMVYRARWSPDGDLIAYQGTRRGLTSSETTMEDTHVWTLRPDGAERSHLGRVVDNRQGAPQWSRDGRHIYFTVQERGNVGLYRLPAGGGAAEPVVVERGQVSGFSPGPDGSVAYTFTGPTDLPQLFLRTAGGEVRQLTDLNAELLARREVAPVEAMTFLSYDGLEVEAFLVKPVGLREDVQHYHPLIVRIKGGPHGQRGANFSHTPQVYAAQGYAVLKVNYRGSTGYGQAFADAIFRDQNGGEAEDVLYGMRAALSRFPWLDPDRVGVEGGSYGGQLSMWLVTQTDEFAAAIPRAGISNLVSFNYLGYYHDYLAVEYGGYPHETFPGQHHIMDELWDRSPLRYVAQVTTPVMLVHGLNDFNVVKEEAEQFYIALHDVGLEPVLVLYPREGHGIREVPHQIDLIDRSLAWYREHFEARTGMASGR
jgi:dipeptidyl aminopeptidase/acylaminoacyl peptidase